ncbi:hypothetical protein IWX90DRAFT_488469 [Phyllosticta citrichinensis]|uniref:Rhodopsin domain-containing protein n=1 Tax=Phyllosticta citrichinensis TaxID=1130410 RepID=A0ABR1XP51_9PEZI
MSTLIGNLHPELWPEPNYVNPPTRIPLILGILIPQAFMVTVFCMGRILSKILRKSNHALGWDDWLMVLSGVLILGVDFLGCFSTMYGSGYHTWDVRAEWIYPWGKIDFATYWLFVPCLAITKVSLCLSYLRLFPSRTNQWFCWAMIISQSAWFVAFLVVLAVACRPMSAFWMLDKQKDKCIDLKFILLFQAFFNSATDFLVFLWPLRILWRIQLPLHRRIGLVITFGFGCLGCLAGALRAYSLNKYFESNDPFWQTAELWCIIGGEGNFGVVCGCLPTLKPIMQRIFPRWFSDTIEAHSSSGEDLEGSARSRSTSSRRQWSRPHAAEYPFQNISSSHHSHSSSRQSSSRRLSSLSGGMSMGMGRCMAGASPAASSLNKHSSASSASDAEHLRMRPHYDDGQYEVFAGRASGGADGRYGRATLPPPPDTGIKLTYTVSMHSEKQHDVGAIDLAAEDDGGSEELILHSRSGSRGKRAFGKGYCVDGHGARTNTTI